MKFKLLNIKCPAMLLLIFFLLPVYEAAVAQVIVSGNISNSLPAKLDINDSFHLTATESAIFKFSNGAVINLKAPSEGVIASEGLNFKQSSCFIKLKNFSGRFGVKTTLVAIAAKNCQFFLYSDQKAVKAVVVKGELNVLSKEGKKFLVSNGETFQLSKDSANVRKCESKDIQFWNANPVNHLAEVKVTGKSPKRFGELYIYSMAILEKGAGTVYYPDTSLKPESAVMKDVFVKVGARVVTSASETARLRLGEKTLIRILPNSEILLKSAHLEVVRGECLIRHGNTLFPIKVMGPMPFLVTNNSSVEIAKTDNALLITIQKGILRIPGTNQQLPAGQKFNLSENGLQPVDIGVIPEPIIVSNNSKESIWGSDRDYLNELLNDVDQFIFNDEVSMPESDATKHQNSPGSLLQQYEIRPESERK